MQGGTIHLLSPYVPIVVSQTSTYIMAMLVMIVAWTWIGLFK